MEKGVELILIRHGETDWNLAGKVQGHVNIPLNERGKGQARALAERIVREHPDLAAIYSSDLDRAYATAEETAKKYQLGIEKRKGLREIQYGVVEGLTFEERKSKYKEEEDLLDEKFPLRADRWMHTPIPEAESYNSLVTRMKNEVTEIAKNHAGEKVAIFSHGRAILVLIAESLDLMDYHKLPNCAMVHFCYSDGCLKFIKIEDPAL